MSVATLAIGPGPDQVRARTGEFRAEASLAAFADEAPVVREEHYVMNGRVRPLVLFWVGRDDIGGARLTWREGPGSRALELLVGSDPARAPRKINRWGFIAENVGPETSEVLGFMKDSGEQTLDEAEARVADESGQRAMFKAVRTTVTGNRAVSGTMSFLAPPDLTMNQLDVLLALMPAEPQSTQAIDLPRDMEKGFLQAMTSLIHRSAGPCQAGGKAAVKALGPVPYLYDQSFYDLSLKSCEYKREFRTTAGMFPDVVDGRFQLRNRTTRDETDFQVAYGTSSDLMDLPVRMVFKPRWWMEVELLLDRDRKHQP